MSRDTSGALGVSLPRLTQPTPRAFIRGAPRIDPSECRLPLLYLLLAEKSGAEREKERRSRSPAPRHNEAPVGPVGGRSFAGR